MKKLFFDHPLVMGIVNITPDSFFDGGRYQDKDAALAHIAKLTAEGAHILDIGAASSRPGYTPLTPQEELARLDPLLEALDIEQLPPLSVDTDQPAVAKAALAKGFTVLNNSGLPNEAMCRLAAEYDSYLVLMYRGPFQTDDIVGELKGFFANSIQMALDCGVSRDKLLLDPGIGFNMDMEQCRILTAHTADFLDFELPLLLGMSNKRFIGAFGGGEAGYREPGNIASELYVVSRGAAIIRVHDVASSIQALKMYAALINGEKE